MDCIHHVVIYEKQKTKAADSFSLVVINMSSFSFCSLSKNSIHHVVIYEKQNTKAADSFSLVVINMSSFSFCSLSKNSLFKSCLKMFTLLRN